MTGQQTSIRVLLIEDDEQDAEYLTEVLSDDAQIAYRVTCAPLLKKAVENLADGAWDIVLCDLSLPDSRGLDTFAKVQEHAGAVPILVLTGLDDESSALEAVRRGAQDYLVKGQANGPILLKAIRYAIERNKVTKELDEMAQQLRYANSNLERIAKNDPLTDLLNRRGLQEALSHEIALAQRSGNTSSVILIDLDDFKKINDTHGHSAGDIVLKGIAARMKRPLRSTDYPARIGGDEFLVLLPDTEPGEAVQIAEKMRLAISEELFDIGDGMTLKATASVGVVGVSESASNLEDLLVATHDVLYESKKGGKNRVSFAAHPAASGEAPAAARVFAVAQPIYRLTDEKIVGYEFLSRMRRGDTHEILDVFRSNYGATPMVDLDQTCWSTCLAAARRQGEEHRAHVNVTPNTLRSPAFKDLLDSLPISPEKRFCVEISLHQIVGNPVYLLEPIQKLKQRGALVAIDDVGLNSTSLETMVVLEPDVIKIEPQYVRHIHKDPARQRSMLRLLKVAGSLNMEVIAEGIESQPDMETLKQMGVRYGQGFLWGQPVEALEGSSLSSTR